MKGRGTGKSGVQLGYQENKTRAAAQRQIRQGGGLKHWFFVLILMHPVGRGRGVSPLFSRATFPAKAP